MRIGKTRIGWIRMRWFYCCSAEKVMPSGLLCSSAWTTECRSLMRKSFERSSVHCSETTLLTSGGAIEDRGTERNLTLWNPTASFLPCKPTWFHIIIVLFFFFFTSPGNTQMVLHITTEVSSLRLSLSGQSVPNTLLSWVVRATS